MLVVVFSLFLHRRKSIPNRVQTQRNSAGIFYGPKEAPRVKELGQKSLGLSMRVGGAPIPLGVGPYLVDDSRPP